jgi:hypothetical protein
MLTVYARALRAAVRDAVRQNQFAALGADDASEHSEDWGEPIERTWPRGWSCYKSTSTDGSTDGSTDCSGSRYVVNIKPPQLPGCKNSFLITNVTLKNALNSGEVCNSSWRTIWKLSSKFRNGTS